MEAHLKFAVAYWHTMTGTGADPFGPVPVYDRPWEGGSSPMDVARSTLDAAFELFTKLGVRYYCFHDRDLAPEGATVAESARNLEELVAQAKRKQRETGVRLLWGTANLFSHPRYTHGAATNPDPVVFAHACAQVRAALDATVELGGSGYVFWGGREGYTTLLNTDLGREQEQLAAFLRMAVDYGRRIGFRGSFFIEPKAKEPTVHQYDFDAATTLAFLREYNLFDDFELNIEANHAELASHSFEHELQVASAAGKLGSIDVNRGEPGIGWDTDNFAMDVRQCTLAMLVVLGQGGLKNGGLNFDAKVRRGSFDTLDLFYAHIGSMDAFARGLLVADRMRRDGALEQVLAERYSGYRRGMGKRLVSGGATLEEAEAWAQKRGEPERRSGRQERLETLLNDYLHCTVID
jgi:xylose isomerase